MIDPVPNFSITQRDACPDRPATGDTFDNHYDLHAQLDRVSELTAELDSLQRKQLRMSNTQYLLARFALQEQISSERLNSGEDLDTIGISIDGEAVQLAGKALKAHLLEYAKLPAEEMVQVASPRDKWASRL